MKKAIFIFLILSVILIYSSCDNYNGSSGNSSTESYEQKIISVEEIELSDPSKFLEASGTYRENFFGDKIKINCKITNRATVATYKDAVVRVTYYSKTKTEPGSKDYTIYDVFPPTSTRTIPLKIQNYNDVSTIGLEVISAVAY